MKRIALALVVAAGIVTVAACHKKAEPTGPKGTIIAKKIQLSWGLSPHGAGSDVYLQTTDETGAQVSHNLGTFPGQCAETKVGPEMHALTAVACTGADAGTELHVVIQNNEDVVILKLLTRTGVAPDAMAREELTRFKAPPGAAIEAKP